MKYDKLRNDLKRFMNEHNLNQNEMGQIAEMASCTIGRFIKGETNTSKRNIQKIQYALENYDNKKDTVIFKEISAIKNKSFFDVNEILTLKTNKNYLLVKNEVTNVSSDVVKISLYVKKAK